MKLYVNSKGESFLQSWTDDELRKGYDVAESEGDDVFYMALMSEFERRRLCVKDPPSTKGESHE